MEPIVIYEDEYASIVYGHNPVALGHVKIFPKPKAANLEALPAKVIAHLFSLATRCASLLFDGLQAQGTNIILNEGKSANQQDDNICIDVIARSEKDGMSFIWEPKQGNMEQIKQTASEISSKVVVYEKPAEPSVATHTAKAESNKPKIDADAVKVKTEPSPEEFNMPRLEPVLKDHHKEAVSDQITHPADEKKETAKLAAAVVASEKKKNDDDDLFDKNKNFLLYELMRMP